MKKIVYLILTVFVISTKTNAQEIDTASIIKAYYSSDAIFEGIVEEICCYRDQSSGIIYTSNKVNISKIFKGKIQCGTINIVTQGGTVNDYTVEVSHETKFNIGVAGIFMCRNTTYPIPTCNTTTNPVAVSLTVSFNGTLEYLFDNINHEVEGLNSTFNNLEEFYAFLRNNGINMIDCNSNPINDLRAKAKITAKPIELLIERKGNLTDIDNQKLLALLQAKKVAKKSLGKGGESIEPYISNVTQTASGSTNYYNVEISVKTNTNSIFLDGVFFKLKYNKLTFGTNVAALSSFTPNANFPSSIYDYNLISDFNDSSLTLFYSTFRVAPTRSSLNKAGKVLGIIQIPTTNCKNLGNLVIDTFSTALNLSAFTSTSNANSIKAFATYVNGSFNAGNTCLPVVNSITNNVNGGVGDIINISGLNFGTIKGSVSMQNADGFPTTIALDKYDIITWTNSQIQIKVPSVVDSGELVGTIYTIHPVGTGPVIITDAYSNTVTTNPVTVNYSVLNSSKIYTSNGRQKVNWFLFSDNIDGKYHFKLHSNITNPKMIDCIYAAMRRWSCTTGIPFVIDAGTVTNIIDNDGVNVIKLSTIPDITRLATTFNYPRSSCSGNSIIPIPNREIDIEINDNKPEFKFDTTGTKNIEIDSTDFFEVILHEIGHGLGLNHVLNTNMLMYPTSATTAVSANNRKIYLKGFDLTGANYIINNSLTTPVGLTCAYNKPIIKMATNCNWNNSLNSLENDNMQLKVYPNPFNKNLTIDFEAKEKSQSYLTIYDINGKQVYFNDNIETIIGKNSLTITELELHNGLYFINLLIDGNLLTYKVLCTK